MTPFMKTQKFYIIKNQRVYIKCKHIDKLYTSSWKLPCLRWIRESKLKSDTKYNS